MNRSRRRENLEIILYFAGFRPWRCPDCRTRFLRPWRNRVPRDSRKKEGSWWDRLSAPVRVQAIAYPGAPALLAAFLFWLSGGG